MLFSLDSIYTLWCVHRSKRRNGTHRSKHENKPEKRCTVGVPDYLVRVHSNQQIDKDMCNIDSRVSVFGSEDVVSVMKSSCNGQEQQNTYCPKGKRQAGREIFKWHLSNSTSPAAGGSQLLFCLGSTIDAGTSITCFNALWQSRRESSWRALPWAFKVGRWIFWSATTAKPPMEDYCNVLRTVCGVGGEVSRIWRDSLTAVEFCSWCEPTTQLCLLRIWEPQYFFDLYSFILNLFRGLFFQTDRFIKLLSSAAFGSTSHLGHAP